MATVVAWEFNITPVGLTLTVRWHFAFTPLLLVAVMSHSPTLSALTIPPSTVATFSSLLSHTRALFVTFSGTMVYFIFSFEPAIIVKFFLLIVSFSVRMLLTVNRQTSFTPLLVKALTSAFPSPTAVTTPDLTVTTDVSELSQYTIGSADSFGKTVAESLYVSFSCSLISFWESFTFSTSTLPQPISIRLNIIKDNDNDIILLILSLLR